MYKWLSSCEFAKLHNISLRALQLRIQRCSMQKILSFNTYFFMYSYTKGIGRGGKVLQIWSEPFNSEAEAEAFIMAYRVDMLEKAVKQSKLNTELARLERAVKRSRMDCLNSLDYLVLPRHDKAVQHGRIESSNIKDIQQNKVNSDNTQSKDIESNRASINTKLDTTMDGVVDSHNSLCNDLYVCDDGGDDARDVSLSLNMTNKGNMTDKQETNLQNVGQKTQDIREIQDTE